MLHAAPPIVIPIFAMSAPNAGVPLYRGPLSIQQGDVNRTVPEAELVLRWLPHICAELALPDGRFRIGKADVQATGVSIAGDFSVETSGSLGNLIRAHDERVVLNRAKSNNPTLASALIHLVNIPHVHGDAVRSSTTTYFARQHCRCGDWDLTIDPVETPKRVIDETRSVKGFLITHVVHATNWVQPSFRVKHVNDLLNQLWLAISFVFAEWAGPMLTTCLDRSGRPAVDIVPLSIANGWQFRSAVAPLRTGISRMLESTGTLWKGPWRDTVGDIIMWYLEATHGMVNASIVLAQAALERMAFHHLVNCTGLMTAEGFERLTAQDKIRLLAGSLQVPLTLSLDAQKTWKRCLPPTSAIDVATVVTTVRNVQVHPPRQVKNDLQNFDIVLDARERALQLLELCLLRVSGYVGPYHPRDSHNVQEEADVPWASAG